MAKKRRAAILPSNIILLQNVVKRDPESYHDEFLQQYAHYQSLRDIFLSNPSSYNEEFGDLIGFVTAVCNCYPKETASFPLDLKSLLDNHLDLAPELREKIIGCLSMLRNKGTISAEYLIQTIFPLLTTVHGNQGKQLRLQIYQTLITLLKSLNTGAKNQKINRSTQALLFNLLEGQDSNGLWATKLSRELWRRGIWDDSRTVEIMTKAALHPNVKVSVAGAKFFLGADKEREENFEENSDDDDGIDMTSLRHKMSINKKSGKRGKKLEQAVKAVKKKNNKNVQYYLNFSAIHLLRDPQGFAEQLFDNQLSGKSSNKFNLDQKILFMNLISRLIGSHKLTVLGIYSFFLKYLTPKQTNVTQIMAASAQASHELVPPESINVIVKKIANEFVSDGVSAEVASAGLNTIREILTRAPLAIDATLLQDLTEYKGSKSKAVMMAARSLIGLYREVAPEMLHRKDRGKNASIEMSNGKTSMKYGEEQLTSSIPGLELLAQWKQEQGEGNQAEEGNDEEWEVEPVSEGEESDIEGEWVNIESDKEYDVDLDNSDKEPDSEDSDLDLSNDEQESSQSEPLKKPKLSATESILSSKILTPADFAKLDELKLQAGVQKQMGIKHDDSVDLESLVGNVKYKQLREERIAHAREGREDREKFGSRKGKRDTAHSTTNKEKARKKNFVMMIHKRSVQGKQKLSLRDRQKVLRAHISKQKRGKGFN